MFIKNDIFIIKNKCYSMKQRLRINKTQLRNLIANAIRESIDNEMRAFHGSGARFNKFDSLYNGSGEGSAAFGPGHYFTNSKQIGRDYATDHGTNQKEVGKLVYKYDGDDVYYQAKELFNDLDRILYIDEYNEENNNIIQRACINALSNGISKQNAIRSIYKELVKFVRSKDDYEEDPDWYQFKLQQAYKLLNSDIEETTRTLYQVDIPYDDKYADWNMEVPRRWIDFIYYCLRDEDDKVTFKELYDKCAADCGITVEKLYYILNNMHIDATFGNNLFKGVLKRFGYIGVKYPSGTHYKTSSTKQDDMNYTVFDDKDIKITNRWDL